MPCHWTAGATIDAASGLQKRCANGARLDNATEITHHSVGHQECVCVCVEIHVWQYGKCPCKTCDRGRVLSTDGRCNIPVRPTGVRARPTSGTDSTPLLDDVEMFEWQLAPLRTEERAHPATGSHRRSSSGYVGPSNIRHRTTGRRSMSTMQAGFCGPQPTLHDESPSRGSTDARGDARNRASTAKCSTWQRFTTIANLCVRLGECD